ncbi:uncharacterized protein LOC124913816 [Impatiens glandulifera]|uniref:uncharacterized protein LOC124913816 n=1 Tax=Impatiens glandulifera TaxID=253017 RepID=UPI001FB16ADF|nr:uncharacterized protein LOC124913816 [Impatiens glandulifera]
MLILGITGIERYQASIEVETNAIKELDPSIILEDEDERRFKLPITTEKEGRETNITGQASDNEFTEKVEAMALNYETLSEDLNKIHLVTSEGKITSQERSLDDGKASDPEVSKDEIEQPNASKDEKPLDILEEEELSNMAPERDKTGNNMSVKDDQLQFEGCSITVADNEEAVCEKHVFASSSSREAIEIEKRVELDAEAQDYVSEAETGSSNTVTEKVISYTEGLHIPLEQNIESLDNSRELKFIAGSLENDDDINTTQRNNLEESYSYQTGSREEPTIQDNKGVENDTNEDIKYSSVAKEDLGKEEEETLTEEATVPDSTTLHDHEANYFDSGFSENKITEDLGQHAEELSMSTEVEKESLEVIEEPGDFTTRTSDPSEEKIKDENAEQDIKYDANDDDAPALIIEETFLTEAQFDHYSVKETDAISCEKHENVTIERNSSLVSQPLVVEHETVDVCNTSVEISDANIAEVEEKSLEAFPGQTAPGVDRVQEIEKVSKPQCQDFERAADVETLDIQTPPAHETGLLKVDENPKNGANDTADKGTNIEDYSADIEIVHAIESPISLAETENVEKANPQKFVKDNVEHEESETNDRVPESSLDDLPGQSPHDVGVDEVKEIKKISEPQCQDFGRVDDAQIPNAYETDIFHVDPKDGDDDTANKVVNNEDYVADLEVVPAIESTLALEESKNASLEKLKDKVEQKEGDIAPELDDHIQERSLEALTSQTAQGVDEVEKISELKSQDLEILADVETPIVRETEELHVDEHRKDGDDQSANKGVIEDDYIADLEVVPTIVSPLELEESKKATLEKLVEDKVDPEESKIAPESDQVQESSLEALPGQTAPEVNNVKEIKKISEPQCEDKGVDRHDYVADLEVVHAIESPLELEEGMRETLDKLKDKGELKEGEIAPGLDDQIQERSLEALTDQSAQGIDEVEKIEKISESQGPDLEIVSDVETRDIQTPLVRETEELHEDEHPKDGEDNIANKGVIIDDYVADLEVVPTIVSPLQLEESKKATLEKLVEDKVDPEESEIAPESDQVQESSIEAFPGQTAPEVENVEEIEKISEPQCEDKGVDIDNYVADLEVVPAIESSLALEEGKRETLDELKEKVELKEGEITPGLDDQIQERSLEALTDQSAQGIAEVEKIDKISESQGPDLEIVADVQTPHVRETEEHHVDEYPKIGDDQIANKGVIIDDYVADLEVVPTIVSPLELEESKKVTLEKLVEDKVDPEESEIAPESNQVQESSHEALQVQTEPEVENVEEIEKISEPQCEDKGVDIEDYVEDLEVVPDIESPLALEEGKKETLDKLKDKVELKEGEIAPGLDDQIQERSLEALTEQSAQGIAEVEKIDKISELQGPDLEIVADVETLDVQTPLVRETEELHVDEHPKDGDDQIANKGVIIDDYVADFEVVPTIVSPLDLEESKKATLEKLVEEKVDPEESEIAPESDQVQESSLEAFPNHNAPEVESVEEIEKISEPQCEDKGVDIDDYVADLEVVPAIESPLALEEGKRGTFDKFKDEVELKEGEIEPGLDDQIQERSIEALTDQSAQGIAEVEKIEKISESKGPDLEIVADVETLDVQTPFVRETEELHVDEHPKDGDDQIANNGVITDDYEADLKVIPTIVSPLELEESKKATLEKLVEDKVDPEESENAPESDQVQESSLEAFPGQTAPKVDNVEEIEKVSEPQYEDKGFEIDDYVADLQVVPAAIESPIALEEGKRETLDMLKDKVELKEGEIAPGLDDQIQDRSLEALTDQNAQGIDEVEKISESQGPDIEIVADVETLDVQTPHVRETEEHHVDEYPKDGDDQIANKGVIIDDYVVDLEVVPTIVSPLELEESKKVTLEKLVEDKVDPEESEIAPESDQVQESSLEALQVQTEPEVENVEEIEKISEPQCEDKGVDIEDYVADLEVVPDIESPLALEEGKKETLDKLKDKVELKEGEIAPGLDDQIQERSLEALTDQTAQGIDEVEKIEKISESQGPDLEIVADVERLDVQTPLASETEELQADEHPKDGDDEIANKGVIIDDYVADFEVVPTIVSPVDLEESKKVTLEKLVEDKVDPEESEIAPESDQVQESSLEALQVQTEPEVENVEEIEKISEPQCEDKGVDIEDYVADLEVVPDIESPLALEEGKKETLDKLKDKVELKEGEIAPGLDDQIQERSLEALTDQTAQGIDEVEKIEKISESQGPDLEIVADVERLDVQTPLASETEELQADEHPKDGDDEIANKGVIIDDYVADFEVVPTIVSPVDLEESKKATLEKLVEDKVDLEESEITPESDQVQESSLEAFPSHNAPEVENVEKIEKISEPQCEDKGVDIDDYVADLEVVPTIESPLALEEGKRETLDKIKDKVELKEGDIAPGLDDQLQERSLEALTEQTAQRIDEVEKIEKISESQGPDLEIVADVERLDVQTPLVSETEELQADEHPKDGDDQIENKGVIIDDYVADFEVVPTIVSPVDLEESKKATLEKLVEDKVDLEESEITPESDQVQESSLEAFPSHNAPEVENVEKIEKISEPQCEDKGVDIDDYVADLEVVPTIESPLALEEGKRETLDKIKDKVELKEGDIAPGLDDQLQERSLEALTEQTAQRIDEVEKIEKISESQGPDLEIVADVERLDVQTPLVSETEELQADEHPKDGDDQIENKGVIIDDYVADFEVVPTIVSPVDLEESTKATLEKLVEEKVDPEESEIAPESDQVQESSLEAFPGQTAPEVENVEEIEKISEPQCEDKGVDIDNYVEDPEVVPAIEFPLALEEGKRETLDKIKDKVELKEGDIALGLDDQIQERSLEALTDQTAQGIDEVEKIEKISESQGPDLEIVADVERLDVQTPLASETEELQADEHPKDGDDEIANKGVIIDDYVADYEVVPTIVSPVDLEENTKATLEKLVEEKVDTEESEIAPESDQVQESSLVAFPGQTAPEVENVEEIEKISEPQCEDKGVGIDDYVADPEVVPAIESPLALEEGKRETLDKIKDKVELKEGDIAPGLDYHIQERSLEALTDQTAQGIDEVEKIEKISESQGPDLEIVADVERLDVQTPLASETEELQADEHPKDGDDEIANKVVIIDDYVADLEVAPTIVSPFELEESKKATLEKFVEDKVDPEESEIAPESDDVQESSLEAFPGQTTPEVENVKEIEKISEPQCEDKGVDIDDYVADLEVVPAIESPLALEEGKTETLDKLKDKVELKEGEIAPGLDDQLQESSLEALTDQSPQGIPEVEKIDKISESQGPDLEIVADGQTLDVQTPLVRATEELHVDENPKDGDDQIENKGVIIDDYVADLEVVPTIVSTLELEESKKATLEKLVEDKVDPEEIEIAPESDQVQESSLEAFTSHTAPEVENVDEIEKISEPQCEDKGVDIDDYVADLEVVTAIESPLEQEEGKRETLDKLKDEVELKEGEIEPGLDDQIQERSLEALTDQIAQGIAEGEKIEKISESQGPDLEIVADVETLDVQTPFVLETEELHVDEHPKDGDDQIANKGVIIDDFVADLKVIPTIVSPLELEESKKATLEKLVEAKVDPEESQNAPESDQVQESSLEDFPGQTAPKIDNVEEIEKISEPQYEDKGVEIDDYVADLQVVPAAIESPIALEEGKRETLDNLKDKVELKEGEIAPGLDDHIQERSLEALTDQSAKGIDEVEKISQGPDIEIVADVETPHVRETEEHHVDEYPKDGDDQIANKGVIIDDYVADLEVVPTIVSPLELEESKKVTLEKLVEDKVDPEESEIAPESDQIQESSLEAFPGQTAPEVDNVKEIEKISELQCEDKGVDIDDYVAGLDVVPTIESPPALEEGKRETLDKLKDKVELKEGEIAPGLDDQKQERSLEALTDQSAQGIADVEKINKISESQGPDLEIVADIQTPLVRKTEEIHVDEHPKDGDDESANKGVIIDDYVADLEVVPTTVSPLELEESKKATLEKLVEDKVDPEESEIAPESDQIQESSLEAFPGQTAPEVDNVKEIEKISELQCEDKGVDIDDYVAGLDVVPTIESPPALEEGKRETLDKLKDKVELKEGEIAPGLDDQKQERSLEALTDQSAQGIADVEKINKISESQGPDLEIVADIQTPLVRKTEEIHVDEHPKDGDDESANKGVIIDDYVEDLEVVPTTVSPLELEESKKATLEKLVEDKVDPEESEIAPESDQVQESSLEAFAGQTAPEVDNVEEFEKISEPQCEDFERVVNVETLDVQTPLAHETGLLQVDEDPKDGEIDTASKGVNSDAYVADVKVVPTTESPLSLAESKNAEKENPEKFFHYNVEQEEKNEIAFETDDRFPERLLEDLTSQSAQDVGVDKVKEIEKISEPHCQNFERVGDVQTPIAHETELLHVGPKDGEDDTANKDVRKEDYGEDLEVVPAIQSPLALEEKKNAILEKLFEDRANLKESEIVPGLDVQVQERSLEAFPRQSAQGVDEVDEIEKISEPECQDFERVLEAETFDVQTLPVHETGLIQIDEDPKDGDNDTANKVVNLEDDVTDLKVDPKDGDDDTTLKTVNEVADLKLVPALESPVSLEESKNATLEKHVKDKAELQESEIVSGLNDQIPERSHEALSGQNAKGVDEVEEIEKISEPRYQDRVADTETFDVQTPPAHETGLLVIDENPKDGDDESASNVLNTRDYVADLKEVPTIETPLALEESNNTIIEKLVKDKAEQEESEIAFESNDKILERSLKDFSGQSAQDVDEVKESEKISEQQDFGSVSDETLYVQTLPTHETRLLSAIESPVPLKECNNAENATVEKIVKYEAELEESTLASESNDHVLERPVEGDEVHRIQSITEPQVQDSERIARETVDVQTPPSREGLLKGTDAEGGDGETNEDVTITEKTEIQDGEKEVFPGIREQTVKEGGDGEINEDEEKIFETQFQDVERVAISDDASIINVGTSPQYETGLQGNVVSQEEENETAAIIEKIEIQDGEKEAFQGICEQGTVTKGGDGETSEDVQKKFESQFQSVERVTTSEDSSIINVGTSPQYESGLQVNVVRPKEENETAVTEKIEIHDGEKGVFLGIYEQGTITEGGDEETSEDVGKKLENQFQDVERVANSEDASIINVGTSPQYETGVQVNVVSPKEEDETTTITEKIENQDGEKESFDRDKDVCTNQDTKEPISVEDKSVRGTYNEERALGNPMEENERDKAEKSVLVTLDLQIGDDDTEVSIKPTEVLTKESFEQSKDVCTIEDTKELVIVEDKVVNETYLEERELVNPVEENERDKDVKSSPVTLDLQTGDHDTEVSTKLPEVLTKESFEQSKDVCTNQDTKELVTVDDKVVTETYHEERAFANPMEENERDKDVTSAIVTLDLQTGGGDTEVGIKPAKVLTKESIEWSKDVSTNQDTKELFTAEDKVVTETYHEDIALVNPMEENARDKDVESEIVTLDLQTGDDDTEVSIKPTEVLTKEGPVELSTMENEGKLKETKTDSNKLIDNDEENENQIKKSIDSPHAKNSSTDLLNEERNVDEESEEVKERFTELEPTKLSLSDLMQKSMRKAPQVTDESIQENELIGDNKEEKSEGTQIKHVEEAKTDEENDEGDEHKGQDSGSDAPVMVEASRDIDIKHTPKKSHNILSGVGSKVKHSIAKVKKAIIGKSSPHPKPPSPRIDK